MHHETAVRVIRSSRLRLSWHTRSASTLLSVVTAMLCAGMGSSMYMPLLHIGMHLLSLVSLDQEARSWSERIVLSSSGRRRPRSSLIATARIFFARRQLILNSAEVERLIASRPDRLVRSQCLSRFFTTRDYLLIRVLSRLMNPAAVAHTTLCVARTASGRVQTFTSRSVFTSPRVSWPGGRQSRESSRYEFFSIHAQKYICATRMTCQTAPSNTEPAAHPHWSSPRALRVAHYPLL